MLNKAFHIVDIKRMTSCFVDVGRALCTEYLDLIASTGEVINIVPAFKVSFSSGRTPM